ncbi:MAG: hypothetical protein HY436_01770, partial [Candidatus Liptonbacteria bacterium]|nr:hypothetical protein [Candidatus Liptonbacteria bacterium]
MRIGIALILLLALALPGVSFAHPIRFWQGGGYWGPLVSCGGPGQGPCISVCDLLHTTQHVIYFGLTILLFVVVPLAIAWGGMLILVGGSTTITAGTSTQKVLTGKKYITGAVMGAVIGLAAFLIVNTVLWIGVSTSATGA